MLLIRRFLVVFVLMFWMGGFMFYGAVVVPTNRIELKDMPQRGTITQRVTEWLNFAGTLALLVLFVDAYGSSAGRQSWRWIASEIRCSLTFIVMFVAPQVCLWICDLSQPLELAPAWGGTCQLLRSRCAL